MLCFIHKKAFFSFIYIFSNDDEMKKILTFLEFLFLFFTPHSLWQHFKQSCTNFHIHFTVFSLFSYIIQRFSFLDINENLYVILHNFPILVLHIHSLNICACIIIHNIIGCCAILSYAIYVLLCCSEYNIMFLLLLFSHFFLFLIISFVFLFFMNEIKTHMHI